LQKFRKEATKVELNYNKLGQRIRKYRIAAHFTQEQLAEAVDVVPSSISRIETNANSCSLALLVKIATALGIGLDALVCDRLPPITDLHLRKDFEALLSDCTTKELNLLIKVLEVTKKALRE
jgi:transcriptional regulator with XRE-family HTH domain